MAGIKPGYEDLYFPIDREPMQSDAGTIPRVWRGWLQKIQQGATSLINLATDVTGTLPVTHGGTGDTTLTVHGVLVGNGVSAVNVTAAGSAGQVLTSNGSSADPTFQAASSANTDAETLAWLAL